MSNNIEYKKAPRNGKAIAGVILLVVGAALLLQQLDFLFFPGWIFGWYTWCLLLPGLYIGARSNFQKQNWFVLVLLGFVFMMRDALHTSDGIVWPIAFIAFGIWMILRRNSKYDQKKWQQFEDGSKKNRYLGLKASR
jgi:membrane-bound ClpP family serine protease